MTPTTFAADSPPTCQIAFFGCTSIVAGGLILANVAGWHSIGMAAVAVGFLGVFGIAQGRPAKRVALALAVAALVCAAFQVLPWVGLGAVALALGAPRLSCGRLSAWLSAIGLAALAAAAAAIWWSTREGIVFYAAAPDWATSSTARIALFIVIGSLINSFFEEALWRHYLPLIRPGSEWFPGIPFLAVLFGLIHLNGLPWGSSGVVMTAGFAGAQSWLVGYARGALGPAITVHFVADCTLLGVVLLGE